MLGGMLFYFCAYYDACDAATSSCKVEESPHVRSNSADCVASCQQTVQMIEDSTPCASSYVRLHAVYSSRSRESNAIWWCCVLRQSYELVFWGKRGSTSTCCWIRWCLIGNHDNAVTLPQCQISHHAFICWAAILDEPAKWIIFYRYRYVSVDCGRTCVTRRNHVTRDWSYTAGKTPSSSAINRR